jgi:hypothetical protein
MTHTSIHTIARVTVLAALAFSAGQMCAQPAGGEHRKPPPEALDACKALKSGQDCSFTAPHGTVKGRCFAPEGKPLACRPKNGPAGKTPEASPAPKK